MERRKELEVLPSMIILEDGQIVEWNGAGRGQIIRQIEEQMGVYFASRLEEWEALLKEMERPSPLEIGRT